MIEYLIESTFCLAIFYLVFLLLFVKSRHYKINRVLLLFAVIFSLVVPMFNISPTVIPIKEIEQSKPILDELKVSNYLPKTEKIEVTFENSIHLVTIITVIYIIVSLIFLSKFIFNLCWLILKSRKSEKVIYNGQELTLLNEEVNPFTFFNSIFVSKADIQHKELEVQLLLHEIAHKNQKHSIDIVLIELLQVLHWFNPFIYLFKQLIKANHEYLADEFVLLSGASIKDYSYKLINHSFPGKMAGIVSGFNHVLIKQRLIMLSKFQQKKPFTFRFLIFVPLAFTLFLTTAFKTEINIIPDSVNILDDDNDLYKPGYFYASSLFWDIKNNALKFRGNDIKIKHGENNVTVNGQIDYLGKVYYLVIDNKPAKQNKSIDVSGFKWQVVKITKEDAMKKYGANGKNGAVEITVME